jgi:hypothetical protein
MSNLAFYASPVDFQKNDKLNNKIHEIKKKKLNSSLLKKLSTPNESDIQSIHANTKPSFQEENENELANFYQNEMTQDINKKMSETRLKQNLFLQEKNKDYLISNNDNMNVVQPQSKLTSYTSNINQNNAELLNKLNHIISMFEEQKEIKTNQKNEEVVLYCFLGIFVIYVLDSFVYIGKYSR